MFQKANHHSISEITLHEFEEMDTGLTQVQKEMAKNDYNIICSKHSRHIADEHGTLVEVKPNGLYAGNVLVHPFPPSVSVPSNGNGCVIFGVCTPSYTTIEVEYRMRDSDDYVAFPAINSLTSVTPVLFPHIGEYCFRIRGCIDTDTDIYGWSAWSDESAFVIL